MIQSYVSLSYASSHQRAAKESSNYCIFSLFRLYAPRYQCHALNIARSHAFLSIFHNTYSRLWILQVLTLSSLCSTIPMTCSRYSTFSRFVSILHYTYSRLWILQVLTLSSLFSIIPIVGFEYYKFSRFRLYSPQYQWHALNTARSHAFVSVLHNANGLFSIHRGRILHVPKLSCR